MLLNNGFAGRCKTAKYMSVLSITRWYLLSGIKVRISRPYATEKFLQKSPLRTLASIPIIY